MAKLEYPLHQVMDVKKRRVEHAEKVVKDKKEALEKEKDKLKEREKERDKAIQHYNDKLNQLRSELDSGEGTTTDKIIRMKNYIKVAMEKVKIEEKKVKDQKDQVEIATKNLQAALNELRLKRQEVDKLETHRKDWIREMRKEEEIIEQREMDEIGSVIFLTNQRKRQSLST